MKKWTKQLAAILTAISVMGAGTSAFAASATPSSKTPVTPKKEQAVTTINKNTSKTSSSTKTAPATKTTKPEAKVVVKKPAVKKTEAKKTVVTKPTVKKTEAKKATPSTKPATKK